MVKSLFTVSDNTETTVSGYEIEEFDDGPLHSTVTNTNRVTIPDLPDIDGVWMLHALVRWAVGATAATGALMAFIRDKDGTNISEWVLPAISTSESHYFQLWVAVSEVAAADWFDVSVFQNTGGDMDVGVVFTAIHLW